MPNFDPVCPTSALPFQVGGRWTGMVIRCLQDGPQRFTAIRTALGGATPKVLTQTLRTMERDGLVTRTTYPEIPPRVEYALTPLGRSLVALLDAARAWTREHLDEVLAARERYDRRSGAVESAREAAR